MIAQSELSLMSDHPLWELLQQRVTQLESERESLQREIVLLREQLGGAPTPLPSLGLATQKQVKKAREAVHTMGATIHQETRSTLRAVAHEHARVGDELRRVLEEGKHLTHLLSQALDTLQSLSARAEAEAAISLNEAQRQQAQLLGDISQLERPDTDFLTIAQRRQAAFQLQEQARSATANLVYVGRSTREALAAESQALWQVSRSLKIALSHINRHAQTLSELTSPRETLPFADLLTAPRPALDSTEALAESPASDIVFAPLWGALRRWAILPLLSLLLSSSLSARGYLALPTNPQNARNESSRRAIARITMRHWLKDINPAFRDFSQPASAHLTTGELSPSATERQSQLLGQGGAGLPVDMAVFAKSTAEPRFPRPRPQAQPAPAPPPVPVPQPRAYQVRQGETVSSIARQFGLRLDTIIRANPALQQNPHRLSIGQSLVIPPTDDAPSSAPVMASIQAAAAPVAAYDSSFIWPTQGRVTQQPSAYHMALDIAAPLGTPIVAAAGGTVEVAGWDNSGYGYMIVIDHGNGFRTRYAHLSAFQVESGSVVRQGARIGSIGSTGRSTGPHLHFEIIRQGVLQNPWNYLS